MSAATGLTGLTFQLTRARFAVRQGEALLFFASVLLSAEAPLSAPALVAVSEAFAALVSELAAFCPQAVIISAAATAASGKSMVFFFIALLFLRDFRAKLMLPYAVVRDTES